MCFISPLFPFEENDGRVLDHFTKKKKKKKRGKKNKDNKASKMGETKRK
jgi:hypothetical protein